MSNRNGVKLVATPDAPVTDTSDDPVAAQELAELERTIIVRKLLVVQVQFATQVGGVEVQVFPAQQILVPANDAGCEALLRTVEREELALMSQLRQARNAARSRVAQG